MSENIAVEGEVDHISPWEVTPLSCVLLEGQKAIQSPRIAQEEVDRIAAGIENLLEKNRERFGHFQFPVDHVRRRCRSLTLHPC